VDLLLIELNVFCINCKNVKRLCCVFLPKVYGMNVSMEFLACVFSGTLRSVGLHVNIFIFSSYLVVW